MNDLQSRLRGQKEGDRVNGKREMAALVGNTLEGKPDGGGGGGVWTRRGQKNALAGFGSRPINAMDEEKKTGKREFQTKFGEGGCLQGLHNL